ncbi:MAG: hypothetical protein IPK12_09250 [Gemmatimonadetes bacterium]|nr:hypothetical protein [Gemmatimonadota bacterium]
MARPLRPLALLAAVVLAAAACSDPNDLPRATIANALTTDTLWTLSTGPLTKPSAYSVENGGAVRTWEVGSSFEFAYDVTAGGASVLLPLRTLGLGSTTSLLPGLLRSTATFDAMKKAPLNGYVTKDTVAVAVGDRFFLRTGINSCSLYGVPLYAKLEVLAIDTAARTMAVQVVANKNCGYRFLTVDTTSS